MRKPAIPRQPLSAMAVLFAAVALGGCATPPPLPRAEVELPPAFDKDAGPDAARWQAGRPPANAPAGAWWKAFGDPVLDGLIEQANKANPGLAIAAARVRQARALAGISEAERTPNVSARAGASREQLSGQTHGGTADTALRPATVWQGRLTASYEVDLFGRVANDVNAAQADAAASAATLRAVQLSLQADVAQRYFKLRALDAELACLRETVVLRQENVRINQHRFDTGDLGELDLARARTELDTTRADALALERQRSQQEHALAVLLGKPAGVFALASAPLPQTMALPGIPPGLPSALLQRRPDIEAAQRTIEAAHARVGVARAAMFPALRLTADGGAQSDELSSLFRWSSRSWLLGALMSAPLIDGGRARNEVLRNSALVEEAVAAYRLSVLTAFADVDDQLAGLRTLAEQAGAIDDALQTARRAERLAWKLYQAGRSGYLEVLDAQRNLLAVERSAVALRGERAATTVALIRALGGGWDEAALPSS